MKLILTNWASNLCNDFFLNLPFGFHVLRILHGTKIFELEDHKISPGQLTI